MTSTIEDWKVQLRQLFKSSPEHNMALVGVGNPFRGDDYVGSFILKKLIEQSKIRPNIHLYDVEDDVEFFVSKLVELKPKCVIFIDACEMSAKPGEAFMIPVAGTEYPFFATHGIPLKLLCERMLPESDSWLLAIQPEHVEFSDALSSQVRETAIMISEVILKEIRG
jgi:hydrogenase maturation protease